MSTTDRTPPKACPSQPAATLADLLQARYRAGEFHRLPPLSDAEIAERGYEAGKCHENAADYAKNTGTRVVPGWVIVTADNEFGIFAKHSVCARGEAFIEVTPIGQASWFLEHHSALGDFESAPGEVRYRSAAFEAALRQENQCPVCQGLGVVPGTESEPGSTSILLAAETDVVACGWQPCPGCSVEFEPDAWECS